MTRARKLAFDHARLASALSIANDTAYEASKLPFQTFEFVENASGIKFEVDSTRSFTCDLVRYVCSKSSKPEKKPLSDVRSPNGKRIASIPQLEPVRARCREREGNAALDRWRSRLRLRHADRLLRPGDERAAEA